MCDLTPTQDLRLALVQSELAWHDPAANRAHFERLLTALGETDLVILPEMFTTGFSMESATLAEPADGPTAAWMSEQAQRLGAVVTGSLIVRDAAGQHRNRLLWRRRMASCSTTTSAICFAWPASTSITRPALSGG